MRVRPMRVRDARAVADLSGQLGYPATPAQIRRRLGMQEKDPDSAVFVIEDEGGRVAGWAHVIGRRFLESDPYAELAGLVVDAAARRKGVGKALLTAAEKWAAGHDYEAMRVRSNVKRVEARSFYEGMGFTIIKSQHVYHKPLKSRIR